MKESIGVRELKIHASRILRKLRQTREQVPITYRGSLVAHLVPAEEYERLKAGRPDFWEALLALRERAPVASLDLGGAFERLRPASKGRRFRW
jgi:prevent-host-death family protein